MLESTENFDYKNVDEGIMSINIRNDKGVKETYSLLIDTYIKDK